MAGAGLTHESVAMVAADLADEIGLGRLSVSAAARRLGVSQPALYRHVDGLAGLRRAVSVLALRELTAEVRTARAGLRGREALWQLAATYRRWAALHPGRAAAVVAAPAPGDSEHVEASTQAVAEVVTVLTDLGVTGPDTVHAVRHFRALMHGFVTLEAGGGFGLPESVDETFARLVTGYGDLLAAQGG